MTVVARVFANFRLLAAGRVLSALFNLGALTVMARALPLDAFGTVVLVHMYVLTIRGLVNLKPFLAVVRWGVPALDHSRHEELERLLGLSRFIDWCTAALGAALAMIAAPAAGVLLGWSDAVVGYAVGFGAVLILCGTGTATGFLRLANRFDVLAWQILVGPSIRLVAALGGWWSGAGIGYFIAAWALSLAAEYVYLTVVGAREYRRQGLRPAPFARRSAAAFHGLGRFLRVVWVQTVLDMVPHRFATLMVGVALGTDSAGLFRAARDFSTVVARPAALLRQVVFPDLTRLWSSDRAAFRQVVTQVCVVSGLVGLVLAVISLLAGGRLMEALFGAPFAAAGPLLTWLLLAAAMELAGAVLRPAGYAMDLASVLLWLQVFSTAVLLLAFHPLQASFGLTGSGVAVAAASLVLTLGMAIAVARRATRAH